MPRLATSSRVNSRRAKRSRASAERHPSSGTTRLASTGLMPAGCGLVIPRLDGGHPSNSYGRASKLPPDWHTVSSKPVLLMLTIGLPQTTTRFSF